MMNMLRKISIITTLLIATLAQAFCYTQEEQEGAAIYGVNGKVAEFVVHLDYTEPYAFLLNSEDNPMASFIEPSETLTNRTGLRVASWGLICNTPIQVSISHDFLVNEFEHNAAIDYELGVQTGASTYSFCLAGNPVAVVFDMADHTPIHFTDYGLFVRLANVLSQYESYPDGFYYSTISFLATTIT